MPGLAGPAPGHPAESDVPAPRALLLRPRQDAGGTGQHTRPPGGKPVQLEVFFESTHTNTGYMQAIRIHGTLATAIDARM